MSAGGRVRHVAIGDPQAPFETFLQVLEGHGLLDADRRLHADVHLVSMGDHFDFGKAAVRAQAGEDGLRILTWLASHPPSQATILLGNHDLARVCELRGFDDQSFRVAHEEARALYEAEADETEFMTRHPSVPDAESLARDYACFSVAQRTLVTELLRNRRFRLPTHHAGLLMVHAGVTVDDLAAAGITETSAEGVARALNRTLDAAVDAWTHGPLELGSLHKPGSAAHGEGRGVLYHRPCDPACEDPSKLAGPPHRRYDPRRLPSTFPQAIGHIRDDKCRELMRAWSAPGRGVDGVLRSLTVRDQGVTYAVGCDPDARLIFTDAGMLYVAPQDYPLLDLDTRQPFARGGDTGR